MDYWIVNEIFYNEDGVLTVNENGPVEETYVFRSSSEGDPVLVETNGESAGVKEKDGVKYVWGTLQEDLLLCEIEGETPVDVKIVIWLDGEDRECGNELIGGQVKAKFNFTAVDKESETE